MPLNGFIVDIRRPGLLVEIQTTAFGAMGRKFDQLLAEHRILLVHPIAVHTYLQRPGRKPRKSPRHGSVFDIFAELVSIPTLIDHPNLMLDVVLVSVDEVQKHDRRARRGRGGYRTLDRVLREVIDIHPFRGPQDLAALLPAGLPPRFTTADIATHAGVSRTVAQQMTYCFRALEIILELHRTKVGIHYSRR